MGRLIDADAFKNFIENLPKEPNGTSRAYDEASILHFIDAQPTAFNVEKVVAELEENYYKNGGMLIIDEVIEIVKRGGVE